MGGEGRQARGVFHQVSAHGPANCPLSRLAPVSAAGTVTVASPCLRPRSPIWGARDLLGSFLHRSWRTECPTASNERTCSADGHLYLYRSILRGAKPSHLPVQRPTKCPSGKPRSAVGPALTIGRRHGIYQLMKSRLTSGLALTRPEYRQRWFGGASCGHVMLVNIGQPSRCGGVPPG